MENVDRVQPGEKWVFDGDVTAVFDNMLSRSIPLYPVMRAAVTEVAAEYVQPDTHIVDLGCSRGEALAPLVERFGDRNRFVGVEVSDPMLEAARQRFTGYADRGVVDLRKLDLRTDYPEVRASVTLSVLTLQFTPIEHRLKIMRNIYDRTTPGGAFVLVEKVIGASASLDELMVKQYHRMKAENGYTEEDIQRKRLSLEGVLVPLTARWNEEMLRGAGFTQVDSFYRWMNFAGWLAVKG